MTVRRQIGEMLREPRTISSVAHELHLTREDVEEHVKHLLRTARAAGQQVTIEPARCRSCGFRFGPDKLTKPGKCPECDGTRLYEPLVRIK
jgi:predicted Zn-ribbon and HTH transcriptional regulator